MIRRLTLASLLSLAGLPAVSDGDQPLMTTATANGLALELTDAEGRCGLSLAGGAGSIVLDLAAPCGFLVSPGGTGAQTHTYNTIRTILWVGGPPDPASPDLCSDAGQPVTVLARGVTPGQARLEPGLFCHRRALDEKDYRAVADGD